MPAIAPAVAPFCAGWHWTLDLLACFPVQAMGCLLLAGTILLAARRWQFAILYLVGASVAAVAVLPAWVGGLPAASGVPLRMLAINLLRGNEQHVARALDAVRLAAPDVIFCSEVTPVWLEGLAAGLPDFPYRCLHADPGFFGVGLFSRLPLRAATVMPLGFDWSPAIRAVVDTAAGPVGLLGVHTPRPGTAKRGDERDRALAAIANALEPLPTMRVVLGDFNATPWNASFEAMLAETGLAAASDGAFRATWPAQLPWPLRIPIDHVLTSPGIGLESIDTGAEFGSDHLPLVAALRLSR
ncbi:MAG: endonuclease/exonuclease/phosphatase family protein [Planctomycetota bacterium]